MEGLAGLVLVNFGAIMARQLLLIMIHSDTFPNWALASLRRASWDIFTFKQNKSPGIADDIILIQDWGVADRNEIYGVERRIYCYGDRYVTRYVDNEGESCI